MRITAACPDTLAGSANALAALVGQSEADALTYSVPNYQDADGAVYRVASFVARPTWVLQLLTAQSLPADALPRPDWDDGQIDLDAASQALAAISIGPSAAATDRIQAVIHDDPAEALAILGLTPIPVQY